MMLYLHGLGIYPGRGIITNGFFEKLNIGTSKRSILEKGGIGLRAVPSLSPDSSR